MKMSISGKDKEGTDRSILENNNKNNSKNNSDNRNNNSTQFKVAFITQAAAIAALYVVLVILFNYCSFGPIQFRIAEALTILPYFTPAAIPGLFVGCLLSNIVPFVLKYAYGSEGIFAMFFVTIGASEFIVCGIIGMLLLFALNPVRNVIFKGVE